ncbi:YybS family protein [Oceanobacillus sp. Castelsardo]|uniref:YybS family protein n=1 Tax=Oceanobacillus sp. Castelsardo TaxID=1851204 RepID=UPI00083926B1|nr:YybS family protein [Oceanobacillus sp. Castelsardo]
MNQSKKITDGTLMIAIYMVLLFITIFVPFLSMISVFLLPVPFVLYAAKYNWKPSLLIWVLAIIFTVLFTSVFTLAVPIVMGIGGIIIGSAIYRNLSAYETLARGAFGFVIGLLLLFVAIQVLFQVNFMAELRTMVSESVEMSTAILESVGIQGQTEQFQELMEMQIQYFVVILPVLLIATAFLLAFISQWISYKLINRIEKEDLYFPPFRTLRFPTSILGLYLIVIIFSLFELDTSGIVYLIIQNANVVLSFLLAIQGFSFIFYYTHHKKLPKFIPILSVILTVLLPIIFLTIVRIIGIFDIGFNMRERLMRKK